MYLAIQVACFDAIFDCITDVIGRLFNLHIVKSTTSLDPKQARQKVGPDLDQNDLQRLSAIRQKSSLARKVFI